MPPFIVTICERRKEVIFIKRFISVLTAVFLLSCVLLICAMVFYARHAIFLRPSDNYFSVTAYPVEIVADGDAKRLAYSFLVDNISQQKIKNLQITLILESALKNYLVSGQTIVFLGQYDLVSKSEAESGQNLAYGVECHHSPALAPEVRHSDYSTAACNITVLLEWGTHSETHSFDIDLIDHT